MNSLLAAALSLWILPASQLSQPWETGLSSLQLPPGTAVFVGEEHYTPVIQAAEAELIRTLRPSTVGWEFLTASEQGAVDAQMAKLRAHEIPLTDFFSGVPSLSKDARIAAYLPVIAAVAETNAHLIALNAPRAIKRQLRKDGFESLPPEWQSPRFPHPLAFVGRYWERFVEAMSGHGEDEVQSMYAAQFYTDDVMAWNATASVDSEGLSLWIAGSFHMEYGLGFPARFQDYRQAPAYVIKLVERASLEPGEEAALSERHPQDGWIADAIGILTPQL